MNVGKLRQLLMDVGAVLTSAGSAKQAEDLERVAGLMRGQDHQSVDQFLDELRTDIEPMSPAQIIAGHVARLSASGIDELAFRQAFDVLSKDKMIKKLEADRVAFGYIGGREKWPSKASALEAIEKEFVARRYDASKMKEVARSRPW
jgi:hypothetical protein